LHYLSCRQVKQSVAFSNSSTLPQEQPVRCVRDARAAWPVWDGRSSDSVAQSATPCPTQRTRVTRAVQTFPAFVTTLITSPTLAWPAMRTPQDPSRSFAGVAVAVAVFVMVVPFRYHHNASTASVNHKLTTGRRYLGNGCNCFIVSARSASAQARGSTRFAPCRRGVRSRHITASRHEEGESPRHRQRRQQQRR